MSVFSVEKHDLARLIEIAQKFRVVGPDATIGLDRVLGALPEILVLQQKAEVLRRLIEKAQRVADLQPASHSKNADEALRWAEFYAALNDAAFPPKVEGGASCP